MKERPLLFKAEMVNSTLEDRKTNTRRLPGLEYVNSYPGSFDGDGSPFGPCGYKGLDPSSYFIKDKKDYEKNPGLYHWFLGRQEREINPIPVKCPYGAVGDRLWVKETHCFVADELLGVMPGIVYAADNKREFHALDSLPDGITVYNYDKPEIWHWRPSIFTHRWASRITLEIISVRCERLQDITEKDAIAEGVTRHMRTGFGYSAAESEEEFNFTQAKSTYKLLWESNNGAGSWDANPFVWRIEFKLLSTAQAESHEGDAGARSDK